MKFDCSLRLYTYLLFTCEIIFFKQVRFAFAYYQHNMHQSSKHVKLIQIEIVSV